jgi:hypothetical protein
MTSCLVYYLLVGYPCKEGEDTEEQLLLRYDPYTGYYDMMHELGSWNEQTRIQGHAFPFSEGIK